MCNISIQKFIGEECKYIYCFIIPMFIFGVYHLLKIRVTSIKSLERYKNFIERVAAEMNDGLRYQKVTNIKINCSINSRFTRRGKTRAFDVKTSAETLLRRGVNSFCQLMTVGTIIVYGKCLLENVRSESWRVTADSVALTIVFYAVLFDLF